MDPLPSLGFGHIRPLRVAFPPPPRVTVDEHSLSGHPCLVLDAPKMAIGGLAHALHTHQHAVEIVELAQGLRKEDLRLVLEVIAAPDL